MFDAPGPDDRGRAAFRILLGGAGYAAGAIIARTSAGATEHRVDFGAARRAAAASAATLDDGAQSRSAFVDELLNGGVGNG
ncbi:MAG TPA: hypothetical protein VKB84_22585 [Candidatus Binataceae bacterium]|nr:hypothetical protein [Candidatus Binataceae bacterium]